ncbi:hypothetical protein JJB09_25515 [Rhizobium sp. KVB221]|uniref:Uncharacterized protein n=1 Tax=Rhizobium setariae TaxID=2801340 RepID=A0A936YR97_9HYPH|nr:hypothetical protein [Rhizobium setariae]MBL0375374.1 hypothetical protein [Rhizobium setariae]
MSEYYGDMTDAEFVQLRDRYGDIVFEEPSIAVMLLDDLRKEQKTALLEEMEECLRRQRRRGMN